MACKPQIVSEIRRIVVPSTSGSRSFSSSSLSYGPYNLTNASFRMIAHTDLSFAFFLHLLTPIYFRSFPIQSNHLNVGVPALPPPSGFPTNSFLRSSHQTFLPGDQPIVVGQVLLGLIFQNTWSFSSITMRISNLKQNSRWKHGK
jgi:hypothetical protein